VCVINSSHR